MLRQAMIIVFAVAVSALARGQACTNPGQVPTATFPVCGATVFTQTVVPSCSGVPIPTLCTTAGIVYADKNPYWYRFTCYTSGTLGFVITPNNLGDDYDWQLFDITGHNPTDVYTDPGLFLSCNWSGSSGLTGASAAGTDSVNCAGFGVPTFNTMPLLIAAHTYLLMISHFDDGTQSGYALQFSGGSSGITDTTISKIIVASASCSGNTVGIKLNKKLKCSSLAADGSDFTISAPGVQITQAVGVNCSNGFDMDSIILTINNTLPAGAHTIVSKTGSDGNTLLDYCDAQMVIGVAISFTATPTQPALIDSIRPVGCKPNYVTVVLKSPVQCTSIAADGSDFFISGAGPVLVDSAIFLCSGNVTSAVTLRLAAPIVDGGTYQVAIAQGSDGNTLTNVCQVNSPAGNSRSFTAADTVNAQFNYTIVRSCPGDTAFFLANAVNGINSWNWLIDTAVSNNQNPLWVFTVPGVYGVRLIVSNGICNDTLMSNVVISSIPPLTTTITVNNVKCFGQKNGLLTAIASGGVSPYTYLWANGLNTFTTNPLLNADTGKYTLTLTDSIGCAITVAALVKQPLPLRHTSQITNTHCGNADGAGLVTETGGTKPYVYAWQPTGGTAARATALAAGSYVVNVLDSNSCADSVHILIAPSIGITSVIASQTNSCQTSTTGTATITATGNGAITYAWSPMGGSNATATGLAAGSYVVTATDSKSCVDTVLVTIGLNPSIGISLEQTNISCFNKADGAVTLKTTGAGPFTYSWSPPVGTANAATGLPTGVYNVVVKDAIACSVSKDITITQPDLLQLNVFAKNTSCGLDNGTAEAIATGGTWPYKYAWSSGNTTRQINYIPPTHLSVTVTDSNGCAASHYGVSIVASTAITASLGANIDLCPGDSVRLFPGNYFSYRWQDGSALSTYTATRAGIYTVSITNDTGCIATTSVRINPLCQDILFPGGFTPNSDGRNDGFGPLGTLSSVREYSIQIFDRWGRPVFSSANPYEKWDGKINNAPALGGTYVLIAKYSFNGKPGFMKKGTIVLMR